MTEMVAQLDIQRCLEHLLGQAGQLPARTGQLDALRARRRDELVSRRLLKLPATGVWVVVLQDPG